MDKIGVLWGILALLVFACHSGAGKADDKPVDRKPPETPGNISFIFPPKGYAHDHRDQLIQDCLDGIRHDLQIINQRAFTDTFTIRFLDTREEMKLYTGFPAGGVTIVQAQKIIYYVVNEKEGALIDHELMHMITMAGWGYPDATSVWMKEGLAAFSQNSCNGYNDEQIYRYLSVNRMLAPMDSLVNQFYGTPEMIAYHQAGCMVEYLLKFYGIEKVWELWQQGFYSFDKIYGTSFPKMEADIKKEAEKDYPTAPNIDWKTFSMGCQ
jgi:hypothetical protein